MLTDKQYKEELDYLIDYARMGGLYFIPVWDAAETVAGEGQPVSQVKEAALRLIGDMLDHGIKAGDMSPHEGESVIPWKLSREQSLQRIARGMDEYADPLDYVHICWFST